MSGTTLTSDMLKSVVARLLAFTDDSGNTLNTRLGANGVWIGRAPDNVFTSTARWIVVRKINTQSSIDFGNTAQTFDIEVMCYGRGAGAEQAVELDADLAEAALLTWFESGASLGITWGRQSERDTLEPPPEPYDRELVTVRIAVNCLSFPKYLTNALT